PLGPYSPGQPADIVVRFDGGRRAAERRNALDHVGIERALGKKIDMADLLGLRLEHIDEQLADHLALHLGISDAMQRIEEFGRRINGNEWNVVMAAKGRGGV